MGRRKSIKSSPTSTGSTTSIRESRRERQQQKSKKKRSVLAVPSAKRSNKSTERSEPKNHSSLPDYSVEEDNCGRLINQEKRLVWPSSKQLTKKQWETFVASGTQGDTQAELKELDTTEMKTSSSVRMDGESPECLTFHEKYAYGKEEDVFIGPATEAEAAAQIVNYPAGFVLYYRVESKKTPTSPVDLWMAYRRSSGNFMHFPVKRRSYCRKGNIHDEYYWRVEAGEANKREFTSLPALVKFYRLFSYIDPVSGAIETFPFFD